MTNERTRINHNGTKYTNSDLIKIGNEVASLWGASCYDFKVNHQTQEVRFLCIEYGERFEAHTTFDDLAEYR